MRTVLSLPVLSWALYDFANTIFSYAVITRYFNDWIVIQRDNPDYAVGLMNFGASLVLVGALPFFGAAADRLGRRKPFLIVFTLLCVGATALLDVVDDTFGALALAAFGIFAFSLALAQYDALLATVAPPEARGRVSGLGVSLGYVGVFIALIVLGTIVPEGDNQRAFLPTALMFLVFALPAFFFVRERAEKRQEAWPSPGPLAREAVDQVIGTVRNARRHRTVGRFLVARFLYTGALLTVIIFMTVYARRVADLSDFWLNVLAGLSIGLAAVGAFAGGHLVERLGPKRVLVAVLLAMTGALVVTGATGSTAVLWIAGPVVGVSLGLVWTADRVYLLTLTRPEVRGEFFGLYNLAGKVSNGLGPLVLWSGTIWLLHERFRLLGEAEATRVAVVVVALSALAGLALLRAVPDTRPFRATAEPEYGLAA